MKLLLICGIILIFPPNGNLNKGNNKNSLIIDFSAPYIQLEIYSNSTIEIKSTKPGKWFIPRRMDIILVNNTLSIKVTKETMKNIYGNLSVCSDTSINEGILIAYDIPNCCPCCAWYEKKSCHSFYTQIENCTTVTLYSPKNFDNQWIHEIIYDKVLFLLPCPMRRSNFMDNLEIENMLTNELYLSYKSGASVKNNSQFDYNPAVGLCFNTSELQTVSTYLTCNYADVKLVFILKKLYFDIGSIQSSIVVVNRNENRSVSINTLLKIIQNTTITVRCIAKYPYYQKLELILCMKFNLKNDTPRYYNCSKFRGSFINELTIDAEKINNGTKLECLSLAPSRGISENLDATIYKYQHELLTITNYESYNGRIFKIFHNVTAHEIPIFYEVIPSSSLVSCNYSENVSLKLEINCSITTSEQCVCKIYTENLFILKSNVSLSISISTERFVRTIKILLVPVYLQIPTLIGLTSKNENFKYLTCDCDASKPYIITWDIMYNNNKRLNYSTLNNNLQISINNDTETICVSCSVKNEAGDSSSEEVCRRILDVEMYDNNSIQMYIINATLWTDTIERKDVFIFSGNKNKIIDILDYDRVFIKCASRIKNERIYLYFNDLTSQSLINVTENQTIYTLQTTTELNLSKLATLEMPFKYFCRQLNHVDETYFIRVLQTALPRIKLDENINRGFLIGQNIQFGISIISLPPATLHLYKAIKFDKNESYYYLQIEEIKVKITKTFQNVSYSTFQMVMYNFSNSDSGKYAIVAKNVRGVNSYLFLLEQWAIPTKYLRFYILLGSIVVITIMSLMVLLFYCKKNGYAVPIIQIQNNMYKSLDGDSTQILSTIWPDPLERTRWTIKPSSRVKVKERIGGGNYGIVYSGSLLSSDTFEELVALKYPILSKLTNANKVHGPLQFCQISLDCFINEIRILSLLRNCPNIIKLYGCVVLKDWINEKNCTMEPTTMVVLEYCNNHSLSEYLIKNAQYFAPYTRHRKLTLPNGYTGMKMDEGITLLDLKRIALGIVTGLLYLSGLNIIHRDLATRNILIDEKKVPKICDFGLAIELDNEYSTSNSYQILTYNKELPYKILAPEALEFKIFYLESDIWSFGLLLWELFNLEKEILFPNINTPAGLIRYINGKLCGSKVDNVLPMPMYADESVWDLIKSCLIYNPLHRPSANSIHNKLMDIVRNSPVEVIRVSSSYESDIYDSTGRESIGSSKFPSTSTSIITLNFPSSSLDYNNNHVFKDEFCLSNSIDESLL